MKSSKKWTAGILAVLLVSLLCATFGTADAASSTVTEAQALAEAGRLLETVRAATLEEPGQPGAVPGFLAASLGTPLLLHTFDGTPSEYLVPVLDREGRAFYLIGVGVPDCRWRWYGSYDEGDFPPVTAKKAASRVRGWLKDRGVREALPEPEARMAPDKLVYWFFEVPGSGLGEVYLPVFLKDDPSSALETKPWEKSRSIPRGRRTGGGSAASVLTPRASSTESAARTTSSTPRTGGQPAAYDIPDVPYHQQLTSYWCGPASLEMVMDYFGPDIEQAQIASVADAAPSYGCYNTELGRAAQFSFISTSVQTPSLHGYTARGLGYGMADAYWENGSPLYQYRYSDLKDLISRNMPVLILTYYSMSSLNGHFRVVKGYNDALDVFLVHDPWYTAPYQGPDVQFRQSLLVDTLWQYSDRWGMVAAPWSVSVNKPFSVVAGQAFTVSAGATYRGPVPLDGQYPCQTGTGTATIQFGGEYELIGGTPSQPMPGMTTSGSEGYASWTLRALSTRMTDDIQVTAQGMIIGSTGRYPRYNDWIGGVGTTADGPPVTGRVWAHDSVGVATPTDVWYLAEGCTDGDFETWVLVQNPNMTPARVRLTYMTPAGPVPGQTATLAANSRNTFNVADVVPDTWEVSTMVEADSPVIAERAMYGSGRRWGHDSIGVPETSEEWYLAEGCTNGGFETWVLVQNPGTRKATVHLTYMTESGAVDGPDAVIPAGSRKTFFASDRVPGEWSVSTRVTSDRPVIAERAMYGPGREWAHDSVGVPAPAQEWYLAEGCTNGGFETWILVQNPNDEPADVTLTYMTGEGAVPGPSMTLQPNTRHTFDVSGTVPGAWDVSTCVTADRPVIAERSMYGANRTWGTDSIGVTAPATDWFLAEGCTGAGFETWVLVQNPDDEEADITITYMTPAGPVEGPMETLPGKSRKTFNVGHVVPNEFNVSTKIHSDRPVIAERAMYGDPK